MSDGLASWYTPGLVDGFGDRLLMFDNTETESLELLRFYPSLTGIAGFEDALHERVRQVGRIPDHAFPLIVAVERLDGDGALALVSTHTPGKRLSTFFDKPGPRRGLNPAFVTGVVTQVIQALTVLQSKGDDVTHGALTPDRIVVTTGGRICVVEHVLGSALRQLNLSAAQLWREFGLVCAPAAAGAVRLDARNDVFQLGVLALEMLLGRRLAPLDLKDRLPDLLDQWSDAATRAGLASDRLRLWLERALQIGNRSYATAADAYADLRDMPAESTASAFDALPVADVEPIGKRSPQPALYAAGQDHSMANAPMAHGSASEEVPVINTPQPVRPGLVPAENRWAEVYSSETKAEAPAPRTREHAAAASPQPPAHMRPAVPATSRPLPQTPAKKASAPRTALKVPRVSPWIAAALGVVALLEGGVIVALLMRQPTTAPIAAAATSPSPETVAHAGAPPVVVAPSAPAAGGDQKPGEPLAASLDPIKVAASNQRSGGVRIKTPIELKVLQGDKVLGSTADGPIIAPAGTYQVDLINTTYGYSARRPMTFRPGQIINLDVTIPPGRLSLNAQPWAEVLIDNQPRGETPLANLSVPVGDHEIVFRHPELGERRVKVTVRADQPARASIAFER